MSQTPGDSFLGHFNTGRFLFEPGLTGLDSSLYLASVKAELNSGADQTCLGMNLSGEVKKKE